MNTNTNTNNKISDIDLIGKFDNRAKLTALDKAYAIAEFDLFGTLIEANSNFCRILGYDRTEMINQNHRMFLFEEQRQEHDHFWPSVISGNIRSGEFRRRNKHGDHIWIHAAYTPIIDDDGQHIGVIKLALDITQQKYLTNEHRIKIEAIDNSQGVIEFDREGYITYVNENYLELTGYEENELLRQHHKLLYEKNYLNTPEYDKFWATLQRGQSISGRFHRLGKNNKSFWIQATYNPIMDDDGTIKKVIKYAHNITHNVETEKKAEQQGAILDILLSAHDSFLIDHNLPSACDKVFSRLLNVTNSEFGFIAKVQEDEEGKSLYIPSISNLSWDKETREWYNQQRKINGGLVFRQLDNLFGYAVTHNKVVCTNNLAAHPASRGFPPGHPTLYAFLAIPITHNDKPIGMIALANRPDGYDQHLINLLAPLVKTLGIIIHARVLEDERKQIEETLRFNAGHDFLTGLPNRSNFFEQANELFHCGKPRASIKKCYLALLDIDFFKKINDKYGHLAGDAVLKELATLLRLSLRSDDLFARIGGEEFIILLNNVSHKTAMNIVERIRMQIEQHTLLYEQQMLKFTISVGVAPWRPHFTSVDDWIQLADENLYAAKRQGRNCVK
ncbi:sensor domain-containing diguanylate cyclase [Brenneria izbisi]|uniref:diguanylate cyclase n=1 Tax=Brenneria izbisi TaxID=2939450 RepID=A0AA42C369_9GAMM|nr:diguanylate cyclase [Brenneria izbisi]MCV9878480.1 diguanylate cyclase [Brenneria izbisi]MCV9881903.1 diguanylate cyclase [Brenneria izbisi]